MSTPSTNPPPTLSDDASHEPLIASIQAFVEEYMSHYDASHDYAHIRRVLSLAHLILAKERARASASASPPPAYNTTLVTLGALLHDVGDKKYPLPPTQSATTLVRDTLLARGATPALAATVQDLVLHVSFSAEKKSHPGVVQQKIAAIPELAIVQDADRLDAIGAVGVARCFAFAGAKGAGGLEGAVAHFGEKLELLEGMMKTGAGREMARERTERLRVFRGWWKSENQGLS